MALSPVLKNTLKLRFFGLLKIPMIAWLRPTVLELSEDRCEVKFPLFRRSKNHLNSMYFGALSVGADCAGGLFAFDCIQRSGKRVDLVFKDFHADFKKRATGDVHFICEEGPKVKALVDSALKTEERVDAPVLIRAEVPSLGEDRVVAEFTLTISLKQRVKKS